MPAKAASLALQSVLPRVILILSPGFISLALIEGIKKGANQSRFQPKGLSGCLQGATPGLQSSAPEAHALWSPPCPAYSTRVA